MGFTSGRYTATWNALAVGQTADGINVSHQFMKRPIQGDKMGETVQDAIVRGMEVLARMRLIEWDAAGIQTLIHPYGAAYAIGTMVGKLDVGGAFAKPLVLTAVDTNPGPTPATQTLGQTILHENFPVELLFAPDLREVPVQLRCYPFANGSFVAGA
jgi:hypothetical protein